MASSDEQDQPILVLQKSVLVLPTLWISSIQLAERQPLAATSARVVADIVSAFDGCLRFSQHHVDAQQLQALFSPVGPFWFFSCMGLLEGALVSVFTPENFCLMRLLPSVLGRSIAQIKERLEEVRRSLTKRLGSTSNMSASLQKHTYVWMRNIACVLAFLRVS